MPAKFVDHILLRDEKDTALGIQSLREKQTVRICVESADGIGASIHVPYELVPELARQLCAMVTRAGKVILASEEQYPDY